MASPRGIWDRLGLAPRIIALLLVALVPLGLIAVQQTRALEEAAKSGRERQLLALTSEAASGHRSEIDRALGVAMSMERWIDLPRDACSAEMASLIESSEVYTFAAYIDAQGQSVCNSRNQDFDFSTQSEWEDAAADPRILIDVEERGEASGVWVIVALVPVVTDGAFGGYLSLSLSYDALALLPFSYGEEQPEAILTFNREGLIVSRQIVSDEAAAGVLPLGRPMANLARGESYTFRTTSVDGQPRVYSVSPIVAGSLYTLGVWTPAQAGTTVVPPFTFPLLMWVASLSVAYFAVHQLVLRHIRTLGRDMRRFARGGRCRSRGSGTRRRKSMISRTNFAGWAWRSSKTRRFSKMRCARRRSCSRRFTTGSRTTCN